MDVPGAERTASERTESESTGILPPPALTPVRGGPVVAGVVATLVGVAVAEVGAALLVSVPSPLDVLGQFVITALPGPVVTTAIAVLGAANRTVLTITSVLVALVLGAGVGVIASRSVPAAVTAISAVALGTAVATLSRPEAWLPSVLVVLATAVGTTSVLLVALLRAAGGLPTPVLPAVPTPTDPPVDRRAFLRLGAGSSVAALSLGTAARVTRGTPPPLAPVSGPAPTAAVPAPPVLPAQDLARTVPGVSPVLTPTESFFRIDTAVLWPRADVTTWQLRITGAVERELRFSYDQLLARDLVEVDATIACVSNEVGGQLIGTARWTGVPLADLLAEARPTAAAEQVLGRSLDDFTAGFPLAVALDGREALVAVGMNGEVLPERHGFPARLVVPGLFGYVSATKWLAAIELTPWDGVDGYWIPRGWSKLGPVKTSARIDVPGHMDQVPAGPVVIAGVAWAPTRGIEQVEVLLDDEPAAVAEITAPLSSATWVQWRAEVVLPVGEHRLAVRATDGTGERQAPGPRPPAPDGAEGWHSLRVRAV